jgi:hypothetical protein
VFSRNPKLNAGTKLLWVGTVVPPSIVALGVAQPLTSWVLTVVVVVMPFDVLVEVLVGSLIVLEPREAQGMTPCVRVVLFIRDRPANSSMPGLTSYVGEITNVPKVDTVVPPNTPNLESWS